MGIEHFRFGTTSKSPALPDSWSVRRLEPQTPAPAAQAAALVRRCLSEPIGSPPLDQLARGRRSAVMLVPGVTRRAAADCYVRELLHVLNGAGIADAHIEIIVATGTHERHDTREFVGILGEDVVGRVRCISHDCRDGYELVDLGHTSFGTPVLINRRVVDADLTVLTGRIAPHYFAGFTGGRKALLPGTAGFDSIVANHRLTLDASSGIDRRVRACALRDNPVHLDMIEAARKVEPDFCLNTLLDVEHRLVGAVCGHFEGAHAEGCRIAGEWFSARHGQPADVAIIGSGGDPYDCNFTQALKAIFNSRALVRPGMKVLWLAECAAGLSPGFLKWAAISDDVELEQRVRRDYDLTGHSSLLLRTLLRRADIMLCSGLRSADVRRLGLAACEDVRDGIEWLADGTGAGARCVVVPCGNVTHVSSGS